MGLALAVLVFLLLAAFYVHMAVQWFRRNQKRIAAAGELYRYHRKVQQKMHDQLEWERQVEQARRESADRD
jgi:hypothetical protein